MHPGSEPEPGWHLGEPGGLPDIETLTDTRTAAPGDVEIALRREIGEDADLYPAG